MAGAPLVALDQLVPVTGAVQTESDEQQALPLHVEEVAVSKRARRTLVRATRVTRTSEVAIDEALHHDDVVIDRVVVGRVVTEVPAVRQEDGVTILPVVEEEVVVTRRLVLKEEVHIRRVQRTEPYVDRVVLRRQEVEVPRTELDD